MAHICVVAGAQTVFDYRVFHKASVALVQAGHRVTYVADVARPFASDGVQIIPAPSARQRLLRPFQSVLVAPRLARLRADLYYLASMELLPAGLLLKQMTDCAVVYDVREDASSYMLMKHYLPFLLRHLAKWTMRTLEYLASWRFDGFTYADHFMLGDHPSLPLRRRHLFYNYPLLSLFELSGVPWTDRRYDVVWVGSMGRASGLEVILQALADIKQRWPRLRALFIGNPETMYAERSRALGLADTIEVTGRVPHTVIPHLLDDCRIGLIGLLDLPKFHKNISMKMFEYWAKGLPVVSSDLPPERYYLIDGKHGWLVRPGDSRQYAAAIERLLRNPQEAEMMGRAGRTMVERNQLHAEAEQGKLVAFFQWLLANRR